MRSPLIQTDEAVAAAAAEEEEEALHGIQGHPPPMLPQEEGSEPLAANRTAPLDGDEAAAGVAAVGPEGGLLSAEEIQAMLDRSGGGEAVAAEASVGVMDGEPLLVMDQTSAAAAGGGSDGDNADAPQVCFDWNVSLTSWLWLWGDKRLCSGSPALDSFGVKWGARVKRGTSKGQRASI